MNKPPDNEYRKPYAGETVYTADRKPIVDGLRVFTNNLDHGVIDLSGAEFEWNGSENRYVLWFEVVVDTTFRGDPTAQRVMQSDDRVATIFEGEQA